MKIVGLVIFLIPCFAIGQTSTDWDIRSDSLIQTLRNAADWMRFNEIVDHRKNYGFNALFDTTLQFVRIREMFDVRTNEFDIDVIHISNEDTWMLDEWRYLPIDSIKPRNYLMYLGCIINEKKLRRAKRWERKIEEMEPICETYYIIETLLDKSTKTIKVSLRIPVVGKRGLESAYGQSRRLHLARWSY